MWFLADDVVGQSRYIQADSWEEAEEICSVDNLELLGEYLGSQMWWDMPKWLEP